MLDRATCQRLWQANRMPDASGGRVPTWQDSQLADWPLKISGNDKVGLVKVLDWRGIKIRASDPPTPDGAISDHGGQDSPSVSKSWFHVSRSSLNVCDSGLHRFPENLRERLLDCRDWRARCWAFIDAGSGLL